MLLTDTHCHLYFDNYQGDLDAVLDRACQAGVSRILVPAIDLMTSWEVLSLIDRQDTLYGAVGVHPNSGESWKDSDLDAFEDMADHPKVVAIGEIGLDYFRDRIPREYQKEILCQQLNLAGEKGLPVILHVRNKSETDRSCIEDLQEILEEWLGIEDSAEQRGTRAPGVIHSFSGNSMESARAVDAGFYLGITGPVTYKNARELREVVRRTDLSRLLVETDGPFLSPQEHRGKRNEPAHVRYIVDKISEVKGVTAARVAEQTAANAASLFMWE